MSTLTNWRRHAHRVGRDMNRMPSGGKGWLLAGAAALAGASLYSRLANGSWNPLVMVPSANTPSGGQPGGVPLPPAPPPNGIAPTPPIWAAMPAGATAGMLDASQVGQFLVGKTVGVVVAEKRNPLNGPERIATQEGKVVWVSSDRTFVAVTGLSVFDIFRPSDAVFVRVVAPFAGSPGPGALGPDYPGADPDAHIIPSIIPLGAP